MQNNDWDMAKQVAINEVCPNSGKPSTAYEISMVKALTAFGYRVLKAYHAAQPVVPADAKGVSNEGQTETA